MPTDLDSISEKLALIRQNFIKSLPERLQKLISIFTELKNAPWNLEETNALYAHIHSIKGSAATFQLNHLSQSAENLESYLTSHIENNITPDKTTLNEIEQLYDDLCNQLALPSSYIEVAPLQNEYLPTADKLTLEKLNILVVDDEPTIRDQLRIYFENDNHDVIEATNGIEAIELFKRHKPDLVLMDIIMPQLNGYEAAREIKKWEQNHFIPLIFLTACQDVGNLVECIKYGGDDFILKPINYDLLYARIYAMQRIRKLYSTLDHYHQTTEEELRLAKHVYKTIIDKNPTGITSLHSWINPVGHFSGDMLNYEKCKNKCLTIMLGDFTGHGLMATIGTPPVSELFYNGVERGDSISNIAAAINQKLHNLLPAGQFFAASFLSINWETKTLQLLNCGQPPIYVVNKDDSIEQSFGISKLIPLGIMSNYKFEYELETISLDNLKTLVAYTDGINEAQSETKHMFGAERLKNCILSATEANHTIDAVKQQIDIFCGNAVQHDDIILIAIDLQARQP